MIAAHGRLAGGVAVPSRLEWSDQDASREHALLCRVNKLLAARGADMRLARSRSAAQRTVLGDYFLVGDPNRHVIITVLEEANAYTSTATVFLKDDRLPDLDVWRHEFASIANASYSLRGLEMTLAGPVEQLNGQLTLKGNAARPSVLLAPLDAEHKVQWDFAAKSNWPLEPDEATAYDRLRQRLQEKPPPDTITVTGTLRKTQSGFMLEVRTFDA